MTKHRLHRIVLLVSRVLQRCPKCRVPTDAFALAKVLNVPLVSYAELEHIPLMDMCPAYTMRISGASTVYYDPDCRNLDFVLAHELGHIILQHNHDGEVEEEEANTAANLLLYPVFNKKERKRSSRGQALVFLLAMLLATLLSFVVGLCIHLIGDCHHMEGDITVYVETGEREE